MLSIGKLGPGQADYYLQAVGQGIEDYYTGAGEVPGRWLGAAAGELDVFGEVDADALYAALNGNDPTTGGQLAHPPRGAIRVPGFDLTFSAPKSVSVLFALGDPDVSRQAREAHEAAVDAALGYMERQGAVGRRGRGGSESVLGNGFLAAAFRHRSSRAGDPQLHTHVLVANMTRGPDGRWTALDARRLYANAKTGGYLYQAHLRAELVRRLGVEWSPVRRGQAEIAGIPPQLLRVFSRRRAELEQQMAERGDRGSRAAQIAALDTRQAKDYGVAPASLVDGWRTRSQQLGYEPRQLREVLERDEPRPLDPVDVAAVEEHLGGPEGLTRQRSSFARREVVQAWCERLVQGGDVAVVEDLADQFLGGDRVVALATDVRGLTHADVIRRADGRVVPATAEERRYSTPELLERERAIIDRSLRGQGAGVGVATPDATGRALARRPELSDEQREMVRRLTSDGDAVAVVVGKAGSGKTFALDGAREAWEDSGYQLFGAALARRAAHELQDGSGIQSTSIAALLQDLRNAPEPLLNRSSILVVDEAGMVGTRQLAELLDHAAAAEAKVVLVGDHHQLPEIDAGGVFRGLVLRTEPIHLVENRRQREAWEREALDLLRHGAAGEALTRYREHGRIVVEDRATDVRTRLVEDWWCASHSGEDAVMLALRREDVADLNGRARTVMAAAGRLGEDALEIAGRTFAVGDHVVCLANAQRLGVVNGTRGTVTGVEPDGSQLRLRTLDGRAVRLPESYLQARTAHGGSTLDHGYAVTGHKAQGMTTGRAFVLGTEDLYREWGYVAMSRGRVANHLYVVAPRSVDRDEYAPAGERRQGLEALPAAMGRSRAQAMASDAATHHALAALSTAELARQRDQLQSSHSERTRIERELEAVVAQRRQAESMSASKSEAERTRGFGRKRADAEPTAQERAVAAQAADRTQALAQREAQLRARLAQEPARAPEGRARLSAIGAELESRQGSAARTVAVQPPAYLLAELGPVPERLSQRRAWHRAARRIEMYRQDFDVNDPETALGAQPRELRQRDAWRIARRDVDAVREELQHNHDAERARSRGPERELG